MKSLLKLLPAFLFLISFSGYTQVEKPIQFKSGDYYPALNISQGELYSTNLALQDGGYRLVQFSEIPTESEKQTLESLGLELLDYIPTNAFFARVSEGANCSLFLEYGVISLEAINSEFKLSNLLSEKLLSSISIYLILVSN